MATCSKYNENSQSPLSAHHLNAMSC